MPALSGRAKAEWKQNRWLAEGILQTNQTLADAGTWQPVQGLWPLTVVVGGSSQGFTAELRVCNARRRPDDSDNGWPTIYTFTENRVITFEQPFIWIKLQVTDITVEEADPGVSANYAAGGQGG